MDGHGIPIVTSNDIHSKSTFSIPHCDYSIECPELKRFENHNSTTNTISTINGGGGTLKYPNDNLAISTSHHVNNSVGNKLGHSNSSDSKDLFDGVDDDFAAGEAAVLIRSSNNINMHHNSKHLEINGQAHTNGQHVNGQHVHSSSHSLFLTPKQWRDHLAEVVPSCTFTKPIPFETLPSHESSSSSSSSMTAIGHDLHNIWDAIMSVRYYNILQRDVQVTPNNENGKNQQQTSSSTSLLQSSCTAVITTTVTTVADIQLQITPTAKPFTSYAPSFNRSMKNEMTSSSSSSSSSPTTTHYNYSITLFAKSYTNEYDLKDTNQIVQDICTHQKQMESPSYTWSDVIPQIIFSSNDKKYISCIIPHPIIHQDGQRNKPTSLSSIVIFTLDWKTKRTIIHDPQEQSNSQQQLQQQLQQQAGITTSPRKSSHLVLSSSSSYTSPQKVKSKPMKKIPIPSYIQSIIDDEEEEKLSSKNISSSVATATSARSTSSIPTTKSSSLTSMDIRNDEDDHPPIIQNPRTVTIDSDISLDGNVGDDDDYVMNYDKASRLLSQITTLCDIHVDKTDDDGRNGGSSNGSKKKKKNVHPLLLAGCTDGSILLIGYKRAKLIALIHHDDDSTNADGNLPGRWMSSSDNVFDLYNKSSWNQHQNGIQQLVYMPSPNKNEDGKDYKYGRLIVIRRNAMVSFYETKFYTMTSKEHQKDKQNTFFHPVSISPLDLHLCQNNQDEGSHCQILPMIHGTYLDYNTVAFLVHPMLNAFRDNHKDDNQTIIQVWYIDNIQDKFAIINELASNHERLVDLSHGFLSMKRLRQKKNNHFDEFADITTNYPVCVRHFGANFKLNYDRRTNALVVSSAMTSMSKVMSTSDDGSMNKQISTFLRPILLIWKWRTSTIGFTLIGESYIKYSFDKIEQRPYLMNDWSMVRNETQSYSLQDVCICQDAKNGYALAYMTEFDDECLQKEIFSIGILSPSSSKSYGCINNLHFSSTLFLTHDSVSYLDSLKTSVTKDMKIQWKESKVPQSYRLSNGCLKIAAIGEKYGRSIAVAAARGFCVLDLSIGKDEGSSATTLSRFPSSCENAFECYNGNTSSGVGANHPKWKMFNKSEETTFVVQAMTWWERSNEINGSSEDMLIGVVRYAAAGKYYLTGWSRRRLGFNQQLIKDPRNTDMQTGIPLPDGFCPDQISLLAEPDINCNRALVLLSARCKEGIRYVLCQLQCYADNKKHSAIFGKVNASGTLLDQSLPSHESSIPRICGVFIAGANFNYELSTMNPSHQKSTDTSATIGVLHNLSRSISSYKVSPSSRGSNIKKIFDLYYSSHHKVHWIDKMWLSDVVPTSKGSNEYWMDFSFLTTNGSNYVWSKLSNESENTTEEVDSFVLGPLQLFPDDDPEKSKIFLGPLSSISDRFLTYAAQERRKISSSQEFSIYCISDCMIGAPTFTSSLVSQFTQRLKGNDAKRKQSMTSVRRRKQYDSTTAAIRVIVSFVTDQLYRLRNVRSVDRLSFYEKMLTDIIGLTKSSLSTVHFTWTFLNIARQLEQHHLEQMFPLPLQSEDALDHILVKDLFHTAVSKGSLPVASSSLPLPMFDSTETLHQHCLELLHHCIATIFEFLANDDSTNLWCIREECFLLQQIYNYTLKLEDSFDARQVDYGESFDSELYHNESIDVSNVSTDTDVVNGVDDSRIYQEEVSDVGKEEYLEDDMDSLVSEESSYAEIEMQMEPKTPSRIGRLASALKPFFTRSTKKKDDELAIAAAASTFVLSGFEDKSIPNVDSMHDEFGIASPGSMVLDDTISVDGSESLPKDCSSEILGKAIALCVFQSLNPSAIATDKMSYEVSHIAILCTLIQSNHNDRDYEVECFMKLVQSIPEDVYMDIAEVYIEKDNDRESDSMHEMISRLVSICSEQWEAVDAKVILDVILTILARCKETQEMAFYLPVLVMIAAVASSMLDSDEKIKTDERFVSSYIYNEVVDFGFSIK